MMTKIGIIAGEILNILEQRDSPLTLQELEIYIGNSHDQFMMGLGSLIRAGLVKANQVGSDIYIQENSSNRKKALESANTTYCFM